MYKHFVLTLSFVSGYTSDSIKAVMLLALILPAVNVLFTSQGQHVSATLQNLTPAAQTAITVQTGEAVMVQQPGI